MIGLSGCASGQARIKCEPMPEAAVDELAEMVNTGEYTALGKYTFNKVMPMCKGFEDNDS